MSAVREVFTNRNIPLGVNPCVSIYPSGDNALEMNQIDFLRTRYAHHTIRFSTYKYNDRDSSMLIAYAICGAPGSQKTYPAQEKSLLPGRICALRVCQDRHARRLNSDETMCILRFRYNKAGSHAAN